MSEESRIQLVGMLWFFSMIALVALFIGGGIGTFTIWHFALASIILAVDIIATPFLLRWRDTESELLRQKAKRERMDNMLRDMSDDELLKLKQRLSEGDYEEGVVYDHVTDDGELVLRA